MSCFIFVIETDQQQLYEHFVAVEILVSLLTVAPA